MRAGTSRDRARSAQLRGRLAPLGAPRLGPVTRTRPCDLPCRLPDMSLIVFSCAPPLSRNRDLNIRI